MYGNISRQIPRFFGNRYVFFDNGRFYVVYALEQVIRAIARHHVRRTVEIEEVHHSVVTQERRQNTLLKICRVVGVETCNGKGNNPVFGHFRAQNQQFLQGRRQAVVVRTVNTVVPASLFGNGIIQARYKLRRTIGGNEIFACRCVIVRKI